MESPESWNALTASFAVCGLKTPHCAWAFAVVQGFVRDHPGDRDFFLRSLEEEDSCGEITGPSLPCRVAGTLSRAGMVSSAGLVPDPWGKIACTRLEAIALWGAFDSSRLESLRRFQEHLHRIRGTPTAHSRDLEPHGTSGLMDSRKPWWKFW